MVCLRKKSHDTIYSIRSKYDFFKIKTGVFQTSQGTVQIQQKKSWASVVHKDKEYDYQET